MAQPLSLSQALAHDPQMALPRRPRLPEDLVVLWDSLSSLIVLGAGSPIVFGGKATAAILPQLLPLLSGDYTVEEITARLAPMPPPHVHKAISLMYLRGLLEDGAARSDSDAGLARRHGPEVQFYSRYLDLTRSFRNRYDVLAQLKRSRVLMISDSPHAATLLAGLGQAGVGTVELHAPGAVHQAAAAQAEGGVVIEGSTRTPEQFLQQVRPEQLHDAALIVLLLQREDARLAALLNAATRGNTTRIACGVISADKIQLGPVMQKPYSACVECAAPAAAADAAFDAIAQELACQHFLLSYLALLTQLFPITSIDHVQTLCPDTLQFRRTPLYKQPRCRACGDSNERAGQRVAGEIVTGCNLAHPLAWFYNENTNFKQYHMVPKGHQAHYDEKNKRAVGGAFKKIENTTSNPLPQAPALPDSLQRPYTGLMNAAPPASDPAQLAQRVAILLSLCAGRRVQSVTEDWNVGFRTTPSAGAMASQNLYLINFGIEGLARGAHYFSPNGHLEQISTDLPDLSATGLLQPAGRGGEDAVAAIVITESYARIESKYVGISYRYTLSDAGAMLASLQIAAAALDLRSRHTANFLDDRLAAYLGCKSVSEFPAVLSLIYA